MSVNSTDLLDSYLRYYFPQEVKICSECIDRLNNEDLIEFSKLKGLMCDDCKINLHFCNECSEVVPSRDAIRHICEYEGCTKCPESGENGQRNWGFPNRTSHYCDKHNPKTNWDDMLE